MIFFLLLSLNRNYMHCAATPLKLIPLTRYQVPTEIITLFPSNMCTFTTSHCLTNISSLLLHHHTIEINAEMARVAPVLSSPYAHYPLHREKWLQPFSTTEDGTPAFIPTANFPLSLMTLVSPLRPDYVWGYGPLGKGYYHLLTKEAYRNLLNYLNMCEIDIPCVMRTWPCYRKKHLELEEAKEIIRRRCHAKKPQDSFLCEKKESEDEQECAMRACS